VPNVRRVNVFCVVHSHRCELSSLADFAGNTKESSAPKSIHSTFSISFSIGEKQNEKSWTQKQRIHKEEGSFPFGLVCFGLVPLDESLRN
jgi:hypothetical protein